MLLFFELFKQIAKAKHMGIISHSSLHIIHSPIKVIRSVSSSKEKFT